MVASRGQILAVLSAISFFNYLDRMVLAVLIEPIKHDLALSDTQLGLVSGLAFALFYAALGLPIARFADRGNRAALLCASLIVWSVTTALTGAATGFATLFLLRMLVGVGEAGCVPASHSLIGDIFPPERRAFAVSVFQAGGILGLSLGLFGAGLLAERLGWRAALAVCGLAGLPLGALVLLTLGGRDRARARMAPHAEPIGHVLIALVRKRALRNLVLGIALGTFATYGIAQWLAAFFIRSHGLGLAEVGLYTGATAGLGGIIGTICGGMLVVPLRRRDARWELWFPAMVYATSAPLFAGVLLADNVSVAFFFNFAAVFVAASGGGVALSAIQSFTEPRRRATAVALMLMLSSILGLGLGPVAVGVLSDQLSGAFGADALRYALVAATSMLVWASVHLALAARTARSDAVTSS